MTDHVNGLHHVTLLASDAARNNTFFTDTLGLRRVKKTVNFDAPDVYHLYYGDDLGRPGTVITYFPFPDAAPGRTGTGEASVVRFAVPHGALDGWQAHLSDRGVHASEVIERFGDRALVIDGPDGERLELVEADDPRSARADGPVPEALAIRGFHSVALRLSDAGPTVELLQLMGYRDAGTDGAWSRLIRPGAEAGIVDIETVTGGRGRQGAGSVHHVAFRVPDRDAQSAMRAALVDRGLDVTDPIDRDYFWSIYFRSPGGVLFEIATDAPGFDRDEDPAALGRDLKLPDQHEHLRERLERSLPPID